MIFRRKSPQILVVDDFYSDPHAVRVLALDQEYEPDDRYFKGKRSKKMLFPYVKEEFERLLGVKITDWTTQPANGCFQKTTSEDPLVWHSDTQSYAGAIYLNAAHEYRDEEAHGTSFWKGNEYDIRRPSGNAHINDETYSEFNLTHSDNWTLVDRVGSVFNRLVLWDGQLIHSATSYEGFTEEDPRLVHLFFFSVAS